MILYYVLGRTQHLQPKQPPGGGITSFSTTSPQGVVHDQLLMSSTTPTKPLSRQLSGASGMSYVMLLLFDRFRDFYINIHETYLRGIFVDLNYFKC